MLTPVFIILIPITLLFIIVIAVVFYRALHGGQFEQLDSVSESLLADNDNDPNIPPQQK